VAVRSVVLISKGRMSVPGHADPTASRAVFLLVAMVGAAGCSSDSSSGATSAPAATSVTAPATTEATSAPVTTAAPETTETAAAETTDLETTAVETSTVDTGTETSTSTSASATEPGSDEPLAGMQAVVEMLSSDTLNGRNNLTAESLQAQDFLIGRLSEFAQPLTAGATGPDAYRQVFADGTNLLGVIPGTDLADQYVLVGAGIPSVFFTDATPPCRHTVGDEISIVDYPKLVQQERTAQALVEDLANTDSVPTFDGAAPPASYADAAAMHDIVVQAQPDFVRFSEADRAIADQ